MKVLITGATGFLGKYIINEFAKHDCEIIAFGRNADVGSGLPNCTFVKGDFTNLNEINAAIKGADIDIVIHAGALSTIWGKWPDFYRINVIGTENVAKACLINGVKRLIFVSSPSIYASAKDNFDIQESFSIPNNELNYYIKSKLMAEKVINKYGTKGLYTVIIRPRGLFGIGDTSIIPRLIAANFKAGVPLINGGKNIIDVTYVENVAYALYLSAISENIAGQVFNITNGEPTTFKELLESLFDAIGIKPKYLQIKFRTAYRIAGLLEFVYQCFRMKGEPALTKYTVCTVGISQTLNIDKAKEKLGYQPLFSMKEGIEIYANWWKENH